MSATNATAANGVAPEQGATVAFLESGRAFSSGKCPVERIDTHGAHVFLAGDEALKIKRAVHFDYMDFSTVKRRRSALQNELLINKRTAPEIYLDLVPITRGTNGALAVNGSGQTVEWALRMHRFSQDDLLSRCAVQGLAPDLLKALADTVERAHRDSPVAAAPDPVRAMDSIIDELAHSFDGWPADEAKVFAPMARQRLADAAGVLQKRAAAGFVRRCHGDLHLDNIVLWRGVPTLFDALEFDEALATIDTLYDLAFLLMDLERRASRAEANLVLNRYLWRSGVALDIEGLAALPLFLGLRAGIRAMVHRQRAELRGSNDMPAEAESYLDAALRYLQPHAPVMIAIGGRSGTGKSTLGAALAPKLGPSPGALHLRSDLERKSLFGVGETERLPAETYTREASARVYRVLVDKAQLALRARHAVVVDAVSGVPDEQAALEDVARAAGDVFHGLWLEAPVDVLVERVGRRVGDASDATADVVRAQTRRITPPAGWHVIDASGTPGETLCRAEAAVAGTG